MGVRERKIKEDDIEPTTAEFDQAIRQDGGMRNLESVVCPFGKKILRELGIDGVIFNQENFYHGLSFGSLTKYGRGVLSAEKYREGRLIEAHGWKDDGGMFFMYDLETGLLRAPWYSPLS